MKKLSIFTGIIVIILGLLPIALVVVGWIMINMIMKPPLLPTIIVTTLLTANSGFMIYIAVTKYFKKKQKHIIELETALAELCSELEKYDIMPYPEKRNSLINVFSDEVKQIYADRQEYLVDKQAAANRKLYE